MSQKGVSQKDVTTAHPAKHGEQAGLDLRTGMQRKIG